MNKFSILIFFLLCIGDSLSQTYHVGDLFTAPDGSQGIVYYINPNGSEGWVVALHDASAGCPWGEIENVPGLTDYVLSDTYNTPFHVLMEDKSGYQNTMILRAFQQNSSYASGVVDVSNGWALPAPAQLGRLFGQLPFISSAIVNAGGELPAYGRYWCSAECDESRAWSVNFENTYSAGNFLAMQKTNNYYVRAVRSFSFLADPEINYLWSTGANTPYITVSPNTSTLYTVTISKADGFSDSLEQMVVVNSVENQTFFHELCQGEEYFGNGFTVTSDETSVPGIFTYTRTEVVNGCDAVYTLVLRVTPLLVASVSLSEDTICQGEEVTLQTIIVSDSLSSQMQPVVVGDILCTDNSIVKPSQWPEAGKTAMGVVFYVDTTGEHGWAIHLQELTAQWGGYNIDIPTMTNYFTAREAITDYDGYGNTQKIRNAGSPSTYPAVYAVDFANGWYVPAAGQLRLIYSEMLTLNSTLQVLGETLFPMDNYSSYQSSTEHGSIYAWYMLNNGFLMENSKQGSYKVRAVRSF
jgi:hypothetical protein